ncbi:hypothetical protein GHI93_09380 [Lactococcus hircilactis]|uniref:YbbR-like domain-containing protein n=1 Tax=Lactococcus hircilactis TaxID=1494462 RepID=A0A7X1Z9F2_9LACT|nr:CdaR family protein [Lactococcus hircilactis]MQW40137.1 hypothetical protein [Lactococcus hircilactis]
MRNKFFTSKFFYILTSVFFAIVLFFNANATAVRNDGNTSGNSVYTATVTNVPIELKYDSNKYFVSTSTSAATVHLSGYNRLQITNETSEDTRNFYLSIDLNHASEGTNAYPIKVEALPSGVKADIVPSTIEVTIEQKAAQEFNVVPKVDKSQIPTGYTVSSIELSEQSVNVTAGKQSITKIHAIEADLPSDALLTNNFNGKVALRAVDEKGKTLPAQISPANIRMKVYVKRLSKEVPIRVNLTGTLDPSLSGMETSLASDNVKIFGEKAALDKISDVVATVDMTGIKESKKVKVSLKAQGVTVYPNTIEVTLTPKVKK